MRSFVALDLPEPLVEALLRIQSAIPLGRDVPEENLHLTLAFLGDAGEEALEELNLDLEGRRLPPCELAFSGLATYGGATPKLLAMDVRPDPALVDLQKTVTRAARRAGLELPRERFRPHVTLIRFGSGLPPRRVAELDRALHEMGPPELPAAWAERVTLYRSVFGEGGARYDPLAIYPLA